MIYEFQATQSFNGYDKPWAGGANDNLWDPETTIPGYVAATNGEISTQSATNKEVTSDFIEIPEDTLNVVINYTGFTPTEEIWVACGFYDEDKTFIVRSTRSVVAGSPTVLSVPLASISGTPKYVRGSCRTYGHEIEKAYINFKNVTAFSPYANVCMPEGFNIWDPTNQEYIQVYAGYVNANTRELYLRPVYDEYAGEELVGPWMSSLDPYDEDTTPTEGAFVIDFGGELTSFEITPFMLQTLLDSLGIRQHFTDGAGLLNSLMDQAQGRVRSEAELLNRSLPLKVIAIGDQLPAGLTFKPISKDVLPGLPGKFIR